MSSTLRQPSNARTYSEDSARRGALACAAAGAFSLLLASCATPSSSAQAGESTGTGPARLSLGVTAAQALAGGTSTFVLESTPDLALHATLPDAKYEGKTLQIRGVDPQGTVVWSYPHLQHGGSFDAVLPVFGSAAARKHTTGAYSFEVLAPDRTRVAAGNATFTSSRGSPAGAGTAVRE